MPQAALRSVIVAAMVPAWHLVSVVQPGKGTPPLAGLRDIECAVLTSYQNWRDGTLKVQFLSDARTELSDARPKDKTSRCRR
jgi:hypothetical protein